MKTPHNLDRNAHSSKHTDIQQEPRRVAPRLEGVVKNTGTTAQKKKSKYTPK